MKNEKKAIDLKLVKDDCSINFGDCIPSQKDILLDAFDNIWAYEEENKSSLGELAESILDSFGESRNSISSNANDETNDCSFLLTASTGSYLIHDLYEETRELCTIVFYSISKVGLN
jgi:hypothetical protein